MTLIAPIIKTPHLRPTIFPSLENDPAGSLQPEGLGADLTVG